MNDIQRIAEQQRRLINDLARTLPLEALYNMNEPLRALASSAQAATQAASSALKAIDPAYVTQSFAALAATRARLQQIPEVMLGGRERRSPQPVSRDRRDACEDHGSAT